MPSALGAGSCRAPSRGPRHPGVLAPALTPTRGPTAHLRPTSGAAVRAAPTHHGGDEITGWTVAFDLSRHHRRRLWDARMTRSGTGTRSPNPSGRQDPAAARRRRLNRAVSAASNCTLTAPRAAAWRGTGRARPPGNRRHRHHQLGDLASWGRSGSVTGRVYEGRTVRTRQRNSRRYRAGLCRRTLHRRVTAAASPPRAPVTATTTAALPGGAAARRTLRGGQPAEPGQVMSPRWLVQNA